METTKVQRCQWAENNLLMQHYHDTEWGIPVHDDTLHFEFIVLDTFQAGLSWLTILKKREDFRLAFDNFDFTKVSLYDKNKIESLMVNEKIIRNRMKIEATINNANKFQEIVKEYGSFDQYIDFTVRTSASAIAEIAISPFAVSFSSLRIS